MCNINQQLKVTQLANFVPMNENKYDEEIESYRSVPKLCNKHIIFTFILYAYFTFENTLFS